MNTEYIDHPIGNLIRAGDVRGYRTMTYMYTIEHVLQFNYAKLEPKSLLYETNQEIGKLK